MEIQSDKLCNYLLQLWQFVKTVHPQRARVTDGGRQNSPPPLIPKCFAVFWESIWRVILGCFGF